MTKHYGKRTIPKTWNDIKRDEFESHKGRIWCQMCGKEFATDAHHGIISRSVRFKKYLDVRFNQMYLCPKCHSGANFETTMRCIDIKGAELVLEWLESAPDKLKLGDRWRKAYNYAKGEVK